MQARFGQQPRGFPGSSTSTSESDCSDNDLQFRQESGIWASRILSGGGKMDIPQIFLSIVQALDRPIHPPCRGEERWVRRLGISASASLVWLISRMVWPGLSECGTWIARTWRFSEIVRAVVSKDFPFSSHAKDITGMLNIIRGERRFSFSILHQIVIDCCNAFTV